MKRISIVLIAGLAAIAGSAQAANDSGFYAGGGIGWTQLKVDNQRNMLAGTTTNQNCINGTISGFPNSPAPCYDFYDTQSGFNESTFGVAAFAGYELLPNIAAEVGLVWFGSADRTDDVATGNPTGGLNQAPNFNTNDQISYREQIELRTLNISGRYHLELTEKWGLNFIGGWSFAKGKFTQSADNLQPLNAAQPWNRPNTEVKQNENDNGYLIGFGTTIDTTENTFLRIEYTYYGFDFDSRIKSPYRLSFDVGYRF